MRKELFLAPAFFLLMVSCDQDEKKQAAARPPVDSVNNARSPEVSARPVHWGYDAENGPAVWASLSPVYANCGEGKNQSPINLTSAIKGGTSKWRVDYKTTGLVVTHNEHVHELINNGHTIQVTPEVGSTLVLNDKIYHLKQFHFHTPSEHTINGVHSAMEIHLVHQADDESLAVIGVLVWEGMHNDHFNSLIAHLPDAPGQKRSNDSVSIDINANLPHDFEAFHYIGSLTTPPCTEDVQWLVLRNSIVMDKQQIEAFSSRIHNNNRPVQKFNDRQISLNEIRESE
jgi:carbonic anhydrase